MAASKMSALKHGLFRAGFMLCDRCVINARCDRFLPGSECVVEKEAFERLVRELTEHYGLDMVADRILAERSAMYLIRISRAEAYEAMVGVTEKSVFWGAYISRLDNTLRGLLNDLAVARAKRKGLEKAEELMVNIEDLLERLASRAVEEEVRTKRVRRLAEEPRERIVMKRWMLRTPAISVYHGLLVDWRMEKQKLLKRLARKRTSRKSLEMP